MPPDWTTPPSIIVCAVRLMTMDSSSPLLADACSMTRSGSASLSSPSVTMPRQLAVRAARDRQQERTTALEAAVGVASCRAAAAGSR
jgi:hypothetical protein